MENTRETIAKIEATLGTEIEAAALKRDLNKMVLALTDSVKNLVVVAKEMADAIEGVGVATQLTPETKKAVKAAVKKSVAKRVQKTPIKPK
jgi:hypothetical protein